MATSGFLTKAHMNSNWLDSYYEALEFFYWEPQHIGRKENVDGEFNMIEKVVKHLRKIEVTLNHNINQFLLLAPKSLHRRVYKILFDRHFNLPFAMHGRGVDAHFELTNAMQPDFLFISDKEVVSIEMKVAAKSSVDQVLKYALLGLAVEMKDASPKAHYLGFLGAGDFQNQWKEKFRTIADLRRALDTVDVGSFLTRQPVRFRAFEARFRDILSGIVLGFINYEAFAEIIQSDAPLETDESQAAEVYRNLIHGLVSEFKLRELIKWRLTRWSTGLPTAGFAVCGQPVTSNVSRQNSPRPCRRYRHVVPSLNEAQGATHAAGDLHPSDECEHPVEGR